MQQDSPISNISQQNLYRSLHFIQQICTLLHLSRPCTKTAMDYFHLLSSSQTHHYQLEIMISAAIFLSAKVYEKQLKIRDILNMVFVDTALHRLIRQKEEEEEEKGRRMDLRGFLAGEGIKEAVQPCYSFNNYNQFKPKILQAEQHLLRVLGFNFSHSQKNHTEYKTLLVLSHQLRLPQITAQTILNTYNDLPFTGLEKWIAGIVYFGYLVGRTVLKEDNKENVVICDEEWEVLFCTKIHKLRNYADRIATHYQQQEETNQTL